MKLRKQRRDVDPTTLKLGADYDHVNYCWRAFEQRPEDHQADYIRLERDIERNGIKNPLIVHGGCVLIGQRRCEIAVKLGIRSVPIWDILDDISGDLNADRVETLKSEYQKADY